MTKINDIVNRLKHANNAYYNSDTPIMSDEQYDALREELAEVDPNNPLLAKVGTPVSVSVWPKVKHTIPMGSQLKINTFKELDNWYGKYTTGNVIWSEKLDGLSVELIYDNGQLVQAITRGDGLIGEDITPNVMKMDIIKSIAEKTRLSIRGEIIMLKSVWAEHFPGDKNPRNTAAGIARRKHDNQFCHYLTIMCYDVEGKEFDTNVDLMRFLMAQNIATPMWGECKTLEEIQKVHDYYAATNRKAIDYEIDGLVIRESDKGAESELGMVDNRPRAQRAYKFRSLSGQATLLSVTPQCGRTGVITPVAEITPCTIGGVTISRVNLDNYKIIKDMGIKIGASLEIVRANDVIPDVISSTGGDLEVPIPEQCPRCGMPTRFDSVKLWCDNDLCPAKTLKRLNYYLKTLDIKGIGKQTIAKLVEAEKLDSPADLYRLKVDDISGLEGLGEKVAIKVLQQIYNRIEIPLAKFIAAIGIPGVSESFAQIVAEKYPSVAEMATVTVEDLINIKGIGDYVAKAFVVGMRKNAALIEDLLQYVTVVAQTDAGNQTTEGVLSGQVFCFTGFRNAVMEQKIRELGGTVSDNYTKKVTTLVCADVNSGSSKIKKARAAGIPVLSDQELWDQLTHPK